MKLWEVAKVLYEYRRTEAIIFLKWAEATNAHGFLDLSRAKTVPVRIIWIILILISWSLMCYQVGRSVQQFVGHKWASTVKETPPDLAGQPFPSIIVCNVNRLKWSKTREYNMSLEMVSWVFNQLGAGVNTVNMSPSWVDKFSEWRQEHNMTYTRMLDELGPKCEDIFFTGVCDLPASLAATTPILTYEYGMCQHFELNYSSPLVGSKGGFTLNLDTQGWDYLPLLDNNYEYQGLMLQLTYNGRVEIGRWIKLYPQTHTTVSMQAYETDVRLEERSIFNPFAYLASSPPCERTPKLTYSDASQYTAATCALECELLPLVNFCNCIPFIQNDRLPTCEIDEQYRCIADIANNSAENLDALGKSCLKNACPQPCYSKYVETQVSMTMLPSDNQKEQFQNLLDARNLTHVHIEDIIVVEIFFSSLSTQVIERYEVMSFNNLISSSGGLLGLWVGMSFLTVFQAIAYFIEYVETRRKQAVKKLKIRQREDSASTISQK